MGTSDKVDFLFRFVSADVRSKLLLDEEALYSTTDQLTADKITNDILSFVPATATITDATACAGGNTYSFSQAFAKTWAIEKDPYRFQLLKHNMRVLGAKNLEMRRGDSLRICKELRQDVVFVDPPWGGPEYKKLDKIDLYLSDVPLWEYCKCVALYTDFIAIKAPTNFNEQGFIQDTRCFMDLVHKNQQLRKMYLYIFKVKPH